jgi:hypothetical protein
MNAAADQVQVRIIEFRRLVEAVEVLNEFTPSLEFIRASYGDRDWECAGRSRLKERSITPASGVRIEMGRARDRRALR